MQKISIIIPVYNEEKILRGSVESLLNTLKKNDYSNYEIVLVQNGSRDKTEHLARQLANAHTEVKAFNLRSASFGDAFKYGVRKARNPIVVLFNADWWDITFLKSAIPLLKTYSIIVGSKRLSRSHDNRPKIRKLGSRLLTYALQLLFGYHGSDSHGLKAFRKAVLLELLNSCITHEIIESELLIRAYARGYKIKEIPVSIKEIRPPRLSFFYRCFRVLNELIYFKRNY